MPFEIVFLKDLQVLAMTSPWTIALVVFFARAGIFMNAVPAIFLMNATERRKRHAVYEALWSVLIALAFTALIGFFLQRDRPFLTSIDIMLLIPPPPTSAFPSGHTATAVAIACALFRGNRAAGAISFGLAALVASARMAAGVHFPTDILGGVVVGVSAFALVRAVQHFRT